MPQGLQVFSPSGELIVDLQDRYSKIIANGAFIAPPQAFPGDDHYADIGVGGGFTNSPDFTVVATGAGYIEMYSGFFRWRVGTVGLFPGDTILWTVYQR
jgi:hypothetical protein